MQSAWCYKRFALCALPFANSGGEMEIKTIGVVGAGQMGNGIAQVAAAIGLNVIMNDIKDEFVERGLATIDIYG